ncbi:MAG: sporulation protein YqfD, partial [Clostridia bacterium]|nr:sporulation protein YqfD [Clostridia bacterium]
IFRLFFGYVVFEGICNYPSKFINTVTKNNINIWGVESKDLKIKGNIKANEYRYIRKIAKATGLRVKITKKKGLPFFIRKNKKHIGLVVGTIVFLIILYIAQMYVWRIEISQTGSIDGDKVKKVMQDYGVGVGTLKDSINTELLEENITKEINDISWMSVNMNSSVIQVQINQRTPPPQIENNEGVSNLVAKSDGQIVKTEVYSGDCKVEQGEIVQKGQLLVSGIIEQEEKDTRFKRSSGKIFASTVRFLKEEIPLAVEEKKYLDDHISVRKGLKLFDLVIPYKFAGAFSKNCEIMSNEEEKNIIGTSIPIIFWEETFFPYETVERKLSLEEAQERLKEKVATYESENMSDIEIVEKEEKYIIEDEVYRVEIMYSCIENIAEEKVVNISK